MPFSNLTLGAPGSEIAYVQTSGFKSSWRTATEAGVKLIVDTISGTPSPARAYLLEPAAASAMYADAMEDWCEFNNAKGESWCGGAKDSAISGGGQYYASGVGECTCAGFSTVGVGFFMLPSSSDSDIAVTQRAVHEFTHVVQKAFGENPAWLMEGGAVFNECFFARRIISTDSFASCMRSGGGGGGVTRNVIRLYTDFPNKKWLSDFGENWCCGSDCPAGRSELTNDQNRWLYYDVGAFAIAFAVHRANAHWASSGGRTSLDFWRSESKGFWHAIRPYAGIDLVTGWPGDVPEGQGWKKALADFTGDATVAEFYAAFEEAVAPGGVVASEEALQVYLEPDADVYTMSGSKVDTASNDFITLTRSNCQHADHSILNWQKFPAPPSSPPAPPSPAPGTDVFKVRSSFTLGGTVDEYDTKAQASIRIVLAHEADVHPTAVSLTLTPGSVVVDAEIFVASQAAADSTVDVLATGIMASSAALESALTAQFEADGVSTDTLSVAQIEEVKVVTSGLPMAAVIGIAGGVGGALLVLVGLYLRFRSRKSKPATKEQVADQRQHV